MPVLLDSGTLTYLLGGRRVTLRAGRLSAFWAATPHQVLSSENLTFYYVVTVPLAWALGWGLPEPLVARLLAGALVEELLAQPLQRGVPQPLRCSPREYRALHRL